MEVLAALRHTDPTARARASCNLAVCTHQDTHLSLLAILALGDCLSDTDFAVRENARAELQLIVSAELVNCFSHSSKLEEFRLWWPSALTLPIWLRSQLFMQQPKRPT
jgi:hypothetical protein